MAGTGTGRELWNPAEYLRDPDIRMRYNLDLLAQFGEVRPYHVVDLGTGPGNVAELMARRWPGAHVLGIDTSPTMLEAASPRARPRRWFRRGSLEFRDCDIRDWDPGYQVDVIFAGACLQWIPGHRDLLPRFAGFLAPGGVLAFQMPINVGQADRIMFDLCLTAGWRHRLGDVPGLRPVDRQPDYFGTLVEAGLDADTWLTSYTLLFNCDGGRNGLLEHVKSTVLAPVLQRLDDDDGDRFQADFDAGLRMVYPPVPLAGRMVQMVRERRIFGLGRKPA